MTFSLFLEGLPDLSVEDFDARTLSAARMAINKAADRARAASAREMLRQVNFPRGYLTGRDARLTVTKHASNADLEAVITGRHRATSLARFVTGSFKGGLRATVKPGRASRIEGSFLMPLRQGDSGKLGNMGLAVRTAAGQKPRGAYRPKKLSENLWLLYGPSVDQVFKTVREDVRPGTETFLAAEFRRLLDLDF